MESTREEIVDTSRYRVASLTLVNYYLSAHNMEFILRAKGVWRIVAENERPPSDAAHLERYERRRDLALTNIVLTIDDPISASVITLRDPNKVWETLRILFSTVSEARVDSYMSQYQNAHMEEGEKVLQFTNRLNDV